MVSLHGLGIRVMLGLEAIPPLLLFGKLKEDGYLVFTKCLIKFGGEAIWSRGFVPG